MNNLKKIQEYSKEDCELIYQYAKEAFQTYTKEDQMMDVGNVNSLLNTKADVFTVIESKGRYNRVRGRENSFSVQNSLAKSIISSVSYAASNRSIGAEIESQELKNVRLKIAPIEKIYMTDSIEHITKGIDIPIIHDDTWLFPTRPVQYDWSKQEYFDNIKKLIEPETNDNNNNNNKILVARTVPIIEQENNTFEIYEKK